MKSRNRKVGFILAGAVVLGTAGAMLFGGGAANAGPYSPVGHVRMIPPVQAGDPFKVRGDHFKAGSTVRIHLTAGKSGHKRQLPVMNPTAEVDSDGGFIVKQKVYRKGITNVVVDGRDDHNQKRHLTVNVRVN